MDEHDISFHNSRKPRWGPFDELILPTRVSGEEGSDVSMDADANLITMTKLDDGLVEVCIAVPLYEKMEYWLILIMITVA